MSKPHVLAALATVAALAALAPAQASSVLSGTPSLLRGTPSLLTSTLSGAPRSSDTSGSITLLNSAGFISGSQVFSDAINIPAAGTLTVQLSGISWLDALQNLNCFVSAPGGGIIGNAKNGGLDSLDVQPGTLYVNWYAQAGAPLFLGAYSINVSLQPTAPPPPVPLPPAVLLLISGLGAFALVSCRRRLSPATAA